MTQKNSPAADDGRSKRPDRVVRYMQWLMKRKKETMASTPRFFFGQRGHLTLSRDNSAHRRFAYLYEDLLE